MSVKKIKPHVNSYCTFCKKSVQMKTRAVWRISYRDTVACESHKGELVLLDRQDDENYSEADYQTWLRL